jgi:hypothetical protein
LSLTAKPYDNEDIYDLTIRLYGNINGLSGLINNVTTLDLPVGDNVIYNTIVFEDFVPETNPVKRRQTINYIVGENQSIYDLAIQLTGSLLGITDIIKNYDNLDDDLKGTTLTVTRKTDPKLDLFISKQYVFATKNNEALTGDEGLILTGDEGGVLFGD